MMRIALKNIFILSMIIALSGIPFHQTWILEDNSLLVNKTLSVSTISQSQILANLNQDQFMECIHLVNGQLTILNNPCKRDSKVLWQSPSTWQITQAEISDLNWNGVPEVVILVWRTFAPWPIDQYLLHPGRIDGNHTKDGKSCHIVLIEYQPKGYFSESWAGSALFRPIKEFSILDFDNDSHSELITLENNYKDIGQIAETLSIWKWNGFGFQLVARNSGHYENLQTGYDKNGIPVISVSGW
jgi:hypothetical protein